MRSKKSLLQILDTNWLMLEDAFLLGFILYLELIYSRLVLFCKNAEGVKTISFLYQDCCIILIQHIRSFFLLMEFEASEYVLDFTNHGKKKSQSLTNIMRDFGRCSYLLLIDDLLIWLSRCFQSLNRILFCKIRFYVPVQHLDGSSHRTRDTILSVHTGAHRGEVENFHPLEWENLVEH